MSTQQSPQRAVFTSGTIPAQGQARAPRPAADRVIRQVEAVDAWNSARRMRECLLESECTSRLDHEVARRQVDGLRRTGAAIAACTARGLARDPGPLMFPSPTAVIAHRHGWFAEKVAALLEAQGLTVVECTDNGADALGAVVAEQPDVVLVGERLAMMPGSVLLDETRLFAPATIRAAQTTNPEPPDAWVDDVDVVFLRHHPPADIAHALGALCRAATVEASRD